MRYWSGVALAIVALLLAVALVLLFQAPQRSPDANAIPYSRLLDTASELRDATFRGDLLTGHTRDGRSFFVRLPRDAGGYDRLPDRLAKAGATVSIGEPEPDGSWPTTLLTNGLPLLLYALVYTYPLIRIARALEGLLAARTLAGGNPEPPKEGVDAPTPSG